MAMIRQHDPDLYRRAMTDLAPPLAELREAWREIRPDVIDTAASERPTLAGFLSAMT